MEAKPVMHRYVKTKTVHSILYSVVEDPKVGSLTSIEELYLKVVFPIHKIELYKMDAYTAFKHWLK